MRGARRARSGSLIGDAVMAAFGVPTVREDDALRAVRAAAEMRERLEILNEELERDFGVRFRSRTGINTGEVIVRDPDPDGSARARRRGQRCCQAGEAAEPGEVLIGAATYGSLRDAVEGRRHRAALDEGQRRIPSPAFRLREVLPRAEALDPSFRAAPGWPRTRARAAPPGLATSRRERRRHLVTVFGQKAGIGKPPSRARTLPLARGRGPCTHGSLSVLWRGNHLLARARDHRAGRRRRQPPRVARGTARTDAVAIAERIESRDRPR